MRPPSEEAPEVDQSHLAAVECLARKVLSLDSDALLGDHDVAPERAIAAAELAGAKSSESPKRMATEAAAAN